jgi:hypothetical protein
MLIAIRPSGFNFLPYMVSASSVSRCIGMASDVNA